MSKSFSKPSSSTSLPVAVRSRADRLEERIWVFEQQIRERDQMIARLKIDNIVARTRYNDLVNAYNHLRRTCMQSMSSKRFSNDAAKDIKVTLKETKQPKKNEDCQAMSEDEKVGTTDTYGIETEFDVDPSIAFQCTKSPIEAALDESQKRVKELEQKRKRFSEEIHRSRLETVNVKGCLLETGAKNAALRSQLDRANSIIESLHRRLAAKDALLSAGFKELSR